MTRHSVCAFTVCFPPLHFSGKERDSESGNDYFGARYYGSSMGRFLSPDRFFFQKEMHGNLGTDGMFTRVPSNPRT